MTSAATTGDGVRAQTPDRGTASKAPDLGGVGVTAAIAVGLILTTLPLRSVFTDWTWLITSIACAAPYWVIVCFFRGRSGPSAWHSVLGLIGSAFVLAWIFIPQHLALGILPTPGSTADVRELITQARRALRAEHAPLASTPALRFMTSGLLTLLAALTDILGVGLRRPLLAGAPMLEILAVASTTSSKPANPVWFVAASLGFLIILLAGTRLQDQDWGPAVDGTGGRLGGARLIAVAGIAAALLVPLVLPGRSVNLIAKATHHSGDGSANSGQTVLSDFASLSGNLKRGTPIDLLQVTSLDPTSRPFYIRQSVLDVFNNDGWIPSGTDPGELEPLTDSTFQELPVPDNQPESQTIQEQFTVLSLGGTSLPVLATPASLSGTDGEWDPRTGTVRSPALKRNLRYFEQATQPAPTTAQLLAATNTGLDPALKADLTLPSQPAEVVNLARKLTASEPTPYQKALAISDYFSNGQNGFTYSLSAPAADGDRAIVTFLHDKQGFCQQYAAAAAVLMREAGLPTRVVIGYTHDAPDANGSFTVTTLDAHAWVETYFDGIGWTPFDPTPLSGSDAARQVTLPYAPHTTAAASTTPGVSATNVAPAPAVSRPVKHVAVPANNAATVTAKSSHRAGPAVIAAGAVVALILLLAGPQLARRRQRRRRVSLALRAGSAEPLWQELTAAAVDYDVLWPDTLTPSQVPAWLNRHGLDERGAIAVAAVAERVAVRRFSAGPADGPDGSTAMRAEWTDRDEISGFDQAMDRWARRTERRDRFLYGWVPRSLIRRGTSTRR
jgi:transglutaminase-like putative cysteine protease